MINRGYLISGSSMQQNFLSHDLASKTMANMAVPLRSNGNSALRVTLQGILGTEQ